MLCDYPCKACGVERLLTEADRIRQLYGLSSRWLDGEWTHNGQDDGCPLAERPVESVEEKEVVEKEAVIYVLEGKKVTGEVYKKAKRLRKRAEIQDRKRVKSIEIEESFHKYAEMNQNWSKSVKKGHSV